MTCVACMATFGMLDEEKGHTYHHKPPKIPLLNKGDLVPSEGIEKPFGKFIKFSVDPEFANKAVPENMVCYCWEDEQEIDIVSIGFWSDYITPLPFKLGCFLNHV